MLRRLGFVKPASAANGHSAAPTSTPTYVSAPPVDPHLNTRYFKVVYRGAVGVRSNPAEPAPEDGQSFGFGDVIEVCGLAVAVPEGVVVQVKQPQGGWVFQRHGDRVLLEEVEALKVEEGDWWYRVVHPSGAHFVKIPSLLPKAPRHTAAIPKNTVLHACRRHTPPGSRVTFVELSDNKGWIVESAAANHAVLEKSADGNFLVEHITGEYRDESEAWYEVVSESGAELLEGPNSDGGRMLELFLPGKSFCASQRFRPPEQASAYVKIKGREAWVVQSTEDNGVVEETCKKLPPPMDEAVEQWYRVIYPGGVRLRASPTFEHTDASLGVLVCGWVFLATRRYRAPGSGHMFLQVATPEGVVPDASENGGVEEDSDSDVEVEVLARRASRRHCGWVPSSADGVQVVSETMEPWIERGLFAYQVVVDETLAARSGPHEDAPGILQQLPPYSVAAVATFLETGDGLEGFVQLAGTGSWVIARRGQDTKMARLPAFPKIDKTPRRFVISGTEGVDTVIGPSAAAQRTGHVLPPGMECRSEMVWSVKGWPGDRDDGEKTFVLIQDKGWALLVNGAGGNGRGGLREIGGAGLPSPRVWAEGEEEEEEEESVLSSSS